MQTTHEMEAMLNRANAASRAHPSTGVRGEFLSRSSGFKASAQRIEREAEQALIAFDLARETLAARASKPVATCKALVTRSEEAHVCTPVTNAHLVCRLLLEKQNTPHC